MHPERSGKEAVFPKPGDCKLQKPGAFKKGTMATSPAQTPALPSTLKVDELLPPITGSLTVCHSNVVALAPSKVAMGTEPADALTNSNAVATMECCMVLGHGGASSG